jgi:acylphosphatase
MPTEIIQVHAMIHGRVQGVSFRYHTRLVAISLGITGWVRNLPNGSVEVLGEGTTESMREFIQFLRQGPLGARVDSIDMTERDASGDYHSFQIT